MKLLTLFVCLFVFSLLVQIPQNLPCSVTLQPGPEDTGKVERERGVKIEIWKEGEKERERSQWLLNQIYPPPPLQACGVDFEIRAFCAKSIEEKIHKR